MPQKIDEVLVYDIVLDDTLQRDSVANHILSLQSFNASLWLKNGVSPTAVKTIKQYIRNGGRYRTFTQLKKTFGLTNQDLRIIIKTLNKKELEQLKAREDFLSQKHNLNTIDSLTLIKIPYIGPFYAKMIIQYRKQLGGFYAIEQLKEVYRMKDKVYQNIQHYFFVSKPNINKLDINQSTYYSLFRHPYIDREQASKMLEYISANGFFKTLKTLEKSNIFTLEEYNKVKHYIMVGDDK